MGQSTSSLTADCCTPHSPSSASLTMVMNAGNRLPMLLGNSGAMRSNAESKEDLKPWQPQVSCGVPPRARALRGEKAPWADDCAEGATPSRDEHRRQASFLVGGAIAAATQVDREEGAENELQQVAGKGHYMEAKQRPALRHLDKQVLRKKSAAEKPVGGILACFTPSPGIGPFGSPICAAASTSAEGRRRGRGPKARRKAEKKMARAMVQPFLAEHGFSGVNVARRRLLLRKSYPLHVAVRRNDPATVQLLLMAGAKPQLADSSGRTPLALAVRLDHHGSHMLIIATLGCYTH
mmetsp:Transcript_46802/g.100051  ORF Transcript_46802/g.100051 Transcript_46802/m.100051 type:complete len:294 (+) Transcript_46802:92-973(+)